MIRCGAPAQEMRSMGDADIFFLRLQLLIIMAKGYLKGYPLGERRKTAVSENARFIFYQALHYSNRLDTIHHNKEEQSRGQFTHLFYQRVQLLAVMARSFATGHRLEGYRKRALADNINQICTYFSEQLPLSNVPFLKVA
jgi:hypothetical protein